MKRKRDAESERHGEQSFNHRVAPSPCLRVFIYLSLFPQSIDALFDFSVRCKTPTLE